MPNLFMVNIYITCCILIDAHIDCFVHPWIPYNTDTLTEGTPVGSVYMHLYFVCFGCYVKLLVLACESGYEVVVNFKK